MMPTIDVRGKRYQFESVKTFWVCFASNGLFGPTRHDRRDRKTCGHEHKSEIGAKRCAVKLKPYKRRHWVPIQCSRVMYVPG